jgi:hypothetical protein
MKVFLFGAGASKAAGYPLTSKLEAKLEEHACSAGLNEPWETWKSLREALKKSLNDKAKGKTKNITSNRQAQIMACDNPEVFLSFIDLYQEVLTTEQDKSRYLNAREAFLKCLRCYFEKKHEESCKAPPRYLKEKLVELEKGDAVITLNWDATVESTLLEDNRWAPTDGYGFRRNLFLGTSQRDKKPLPPMPKSQICVLKLHGSVGWYKNGDRLYFDRDFLSNFPFPSKDGTRCFDPQQPNKLPSCDRAVMAYPTYLKELAGYEMQQVWHRAAEVLRKANVVEVWGYSLPKSDAAVRVLLNALPFNRKVHICVHDPCEGARKRWCEFLRESKGKVCIDGQKLVAI